MNKRLILIYSILFMHMPGMLAQSTSFEDRKQILANLDSLLHAYIDNVDLTNLEGTRTSSRKMIAFGNIFTEDASINNRYSPPQLEGNGKFDYFDFVGEEVSVRKYMTDIQARYPNGISLNVQKVSADYSKLSERKASFLIEQSFRGKHAEGATFISTDLFKLEIRIAADNSTLIESASHISGNLQCENCDWDEDGRADIVDDCPKAYGLERFKGCPDTDGDKVPDHLDKCPGIKGSNDGCPDGDKLFDIELSISGFGSGNSIDAGSVSGNIAGLQTYLNHEGSSFSSSWIGGSGEIAIFPGESFPGKGKIGLSVGALFQSQSVEFANENYFIEDEESSDTRSRRYIPILTVNRASETVDRTNILIPLLLKFRSKTDRSAGLGFYVDAGVLIPISNSSSNVTTNATLDREARYIFNSDLGPDGEFLLTRDFVSKHIADNSEAGIVAYFESKRVEQGYEVALGSEITDDHTSSIEADLTYMLRIGGIYRFSSMVSLNLGAVVAIENASNPDAQNLDSYMLSESTDQYSSILMSAQELNSTSFGVQLGLIINLMKE